MGRSVEMVVTSTRRIPSRAVSPLVTEMRSLHARYCTVADRVARLPVLEPEQTMKAKNWDTIAAKSDHRSPLLRMSWVSGRPASLKDSVDTAQI